MVTIQKTELAAEIVGQLDTGEELQYWMSRPFLHAVYNQLGNSVWFYNGRNGIQMQPYQGSDWNVVLAPPHFFLRSE